MNRADALISSGLALERAGQLVAALEHYRVALTESPGHADAWHCHGVLLARIGRLAEAEQSHRAYLQTHPSSARARCNLADVLLALGRYDEAAEALGGLEDPTAVVRRGVALSCLRRFDEARDVFALARSRFPQEVAEFVEGIAPGADLDVMLSPENIFIERGFFATGLCDWRGWHSYVEEMRRAASDPAIPLEPAAAFMALHLPLSGAERHGVARGIAARTEAKVVAMQPAPPRSRQRIRVGVLSPDFREHLNAYVLRPLFELADRTRFELFAYSLTPDDGSAIRARVRSAADVFRDLCSVSDREAAQAIRKDDIDVLVDVGGHTTGARFAIVAQRPARVQASYQAFPNSLASTRVDYAIVDRVVATPGPEWTERLAYLPHTFFLYDFREIPPPLPLTRREYGLPEDAFVYCAFHKPEKISPDSFALWMEVLRRVPKSVLWFRGLSPAAERNLRLAAGSHGVDPSRLVFAPFETFAGGRYLARQRLGDLLLDALHHNAITNACDALNVGLPVLTLRGTAMASRAAESVVLAAGLPELVAPDPEEFVRTAEDLAVNPSLLAGYKKRLWLRDAPLFDTAGRVRELETCLQEMLC